MFVEVHKPDLPRYVHPTTVFYSVIFIRPLPGVSELIDHDLLNLN